SHARALPPGGFCAGYPVAPPRAAHPGRHGVADGCVLGGVAGVGPLVRPRARVRAPGAGAAGDGRYGGLWGQRLGPWRHAPGRSGAGAPPPAVEPAARLTSPLTSRLTQGGPTRHNTRNTTDQGIYTCLQRKSGFSPASNPRAICIWATIWAPSAIG